MENNLSSPVNPISDNAAQGLIDAFKSFGKSAKEASEAFSCMNKGLLKSQLRFFELQAIYYLCLQVLYSQKVNNCFFIFRWYWRRKLYKTIITLRKYQQGKSYIESLLKD